MVTPPSARSRVGLIVVGFVAIALVVAVVSGGGASLLRGVGLLAAEAPANDSFVAAEPVADTTFVGTTEGATGDQSEIDAGLAAPGEQTVWFTWTPARHGWTYLSPTQVGEPMPEVAVLTGTTMDDLTRIDEGGEGAVSIPAVAGASYRVAVTTGAPGAAFDLTALQPDQGTPPNDRPTEAIDIASAVEEAVGTGAPAEVAYDTLGGATIDAGEVGAAGPAMHTVWYAWTPTTDGNVGFTAEPGPHTTGPFRIGVWTGDDIATLSPVDDGFEQVDTSVTAGTRYLISVDGPEDWYRLLVSTTGIGGADRAAPDVVCDPAPTGWISSLVTVPCTATDAGAGLVDPADASFGLSFDPPAGVEGTDGATDVRVVCDAAANCAEAGPVGPISFDTRPPDVTCDPAPVTWVAGDATITCTAADSGSGLADPADASRSVPTGVAPGTAAAVTLPERQVCDVAGNCTTVAPIGPIQVDRAPPAVTCDPAPSGPQATDVTIGCTASDEGSGLVDPNAQVFELRTSVPDGTDDLDAATDAREVCDLVGNCTTAGPVTGLVIDRAPPLVACEEPSGWATGAVEVPCTIEDPGVGLEPGAPTEVVLHADVTPGTESEAVSTDSVPVCDAVGNCTTAGPITGIRIDRKAPVVTCGTAPAVWSRDPVVLTCGATDGGAGLADPAQDVITFEVTGTDGEEVRAVSGSVEVCDGAGNCATAGPVGDVLVDRRAPEVTCEQPPAGTLRDEAAIACTAEDGGAGLRSELDGSFFLVTDVGAGNVDPAASTDHREVCDVTGNCTTAGPFQVAIDRSGPVPIGDPLQVPGRVTVLAATSPAAPVPAPYTVPDGAGRRVDCRPGSGTVLDMGWTWIVCSAVDGAGVRGTGSFPLVEKALPSLAPTGPAVAGGAWRAVGVGFLPGSPVRVELDGVEVGSGTAAADGRFSLDLTVPAGTSTGKHLFVVRGADPDGDELLVVSPTQVELVADGETPPVTPPAGAPALPATGPDVPADPGPVPPGPQLAPAEVPPAPTTTTTPLEELPSTTTSTEPGETTSTTGGVGVEEEEPTSGWTGALPVTGAVIGLLVLIALALLALGRVLTGAARRAGDSEHDDSQAA